MISYKWIAVLSICFATLVFGEEDIEFLPRLEGVHDLEGTDVQVGVTHFDSVSSDSTYHGWWGWPLPYWGFRARYGYFDTLIAGSAVDTAKHLKYEWFVDSIVVDAQRSISFAGLVDENGDTLPATITNGHIFLMPRTERSAYISDKDSSSCEITLMPNGEGVAKFDLYIRKKKE